MLNMLAYDQFLKDLKGNLIFQNLKNVDHKKKNLKNCVFSLNFFLNIIYFRSSCGKKEQNRQNRSQTSQIFFLRLWLYKIPGAPRSMPLTM